MKNLKLSALLIITSVSFGAAAGQSGLMQETVSVLGFEKVNVQKVEPLYRTYTERREVCKNEQVVENNATKDAGPAGVIIGTIAGGILGNQVGGGSGKVLATGLGMITGAIAGDKLSRREDRSPTSRAVKVCHDESVPVRVPAGFEVTFSHLDRSYTIVTDEYPGSYVDLVVGVRNIEASDSRPNFKSSTGGYR